MKSYNQFINEGVRDLMTGKSEEDILKKFNKYHPLDMIIKGVSNDSLFLVKKGVEILSKETNMSVVLEILNNNLNNLYFIKVVEKEYIGIIEYLLDIGFKPTKTHILWIVVNGSIDIIKLIIKHGFTIDDNAIEQVMNYRTENKDEVLELLKKHNENRFINRIKRKFQYKKTNESIRDKMLPKSDDDIRKLFINLSPIDKLIKASYGGILWAVKEAVEELRYSSEDGIWDAFDDAMSFACFGGHLDIVKYLYSDGADINLLSVYFNVAVSNNQLEVVKFLLSKGIIEDSGEAIDLAYEKNYQEIYNFLRNCKSYIRKKW